MPTNKRERVYIYASKRPHSAQSWKEIGLEPGDLPTGVIVGTVEVVGCGKVPGEYEWDLARPVRLKRPLKPKSSSAGVVLSILSEPLQRQGTDLIGPFPSFGSDPNQE